MSMKNPVTPPEIDPGTVRLVAQHLNHYAKPGPIYARYVHKMFKIGADGTLKFDPLLLLYEQSEQVGSAKLLTPLPESFL
jgi:hypothetical protein